MLSWRLWRQIYHFTWHMFVQRQQGLSATLTHNCQIVGLLQTTKLLLFWFERDFDLVIFGSRWVDLHYVNGVSTLYDDWEQKWMMFLLNFNVKTTCGFFGLLLTPTTAGDQLDVVNLIYWPARSAVRLLPPPPVGDLRYSRTVKVWGPVWLTIVWSKWTIDN